VAAILFSTAYYCRFKAIYLISGRRPSHSAPRRRTRRSEAPSLHAHISTKSGVSVLDKFLISRWIFSGWLLLACLTTTMPALADANPVGWWKFDEGTGTTTADASGNSNTGTLTNSPTWTTGRVGPDALSFSGSTSYVSVNDATNLDSLYSAGMTVTAWINPTSAGGAGKGRIIDKDNHVGGWYFCMYSTSNLQFDVPQFGTTAAYRVSSSSISLNTWQQVTVTWDGSTSAGVPAYSLSPDITGDIRCFVAAINLLQTTPDSAVRTAAFSSALYYLGRLDGRNQTLDLETLLVAESWKMTQSDMRLELQKCGNALSARGAVITAIGQKLTHSGNPPSPK
jgi:hypothetical protein